MEASALSTWSFAWGQAVQLGFGTIGLQYQERGQQPSPNHDLCASRLEPIVMSVVPSFAHEVLGAPFEPPLSHQDPDYALHVPTTTVDKKDDGTPDE